jgi:hypothetical protein
MKFFTLTTLLTCVLSISPSFAAKRHSPKAIIETLGPCTDQPRMCPQFVDSVQACRASIKTQKFEEDAHDTDNAGCIKMRLWKKICAKGLESDQVKVTCQ